jgi:hypothetical protein
MILYGVLAGLCLIAGFGLGLYENDVRWQIVEAVTEVRPDLEPYAEFSRARSWDSDLHRIHAAHYPESHLLRWHKTVSLAAIVSFLAFALFLVLALKHS